MTRRLMLLVLVFMVTSSCGNGQDPAPNSLFDSVGKFMVSVSDVMHTVSKNLNDVIEGVRTLENVITDAIEENCEFKCANGAKPKLNPYYKPSSNGCGAVGLQIAKDDLPVNEMTHCCDVHDICYDTCNEDKEDCDKLFKRCLYRTCEKHVGQSKDRILITHCKAAAKFMYVGTMAVGCRPYKDAQANACYCAERHDNNEL